MSEGRPGGHSRSKSHLAVALLHPDNGKGGIDTQTAGHGHKPSNATSEMSPQSPITPRSPNYLASPLLKQIPAGSSDARTASSHNVSVEQSVRMFRLYETLRNGDLPAITKALKEASARPGGEEVTRTSMDSSLSASLTAGSLNGTTILHLAIQCAERSVVEYILAQVTKNPEITLDINARDKDGNTPLHLAAMLGQAEVVRILLNQDGMDDTLVNLQGRSPLDVARNPETFQQLQLARSIFLESKVTEIHRLVSSGDHEALQNLLVNPRVHAVLDINSTELATDPVIVHSGGTLLHEAARKKNIRLVETLLLNGADPFHRDRHGKLPQDVTKDDRTRVVLNKSPAAAAAQMSIQEKAVLGDTSFRNPAALAINTTGERLTVGKESREMKGYLKKWTNYSGGYKLRWFVLEDGVLSYYKHQDDTGSACRGAINMGIAKLYMDPQDKERFEIQGKSSVKYHLKANHVVEAKRWFWALNNAIRWIKDEVKEEERKKRRDAEMLEAMKSKHTGPVLAGESHPSKTLPSDARLSIGTSPRIGGQSPVSMSGTGFGNTAADGRRTSTAAPATAGEEGLARAKSHESNTNTDFENNASAVGEDSDDIERFEDEASMIEYPRDSSIPTIDTTARSTMLQLDLLSELSTALQAERLKSPETPISHPSIIQAMASYEAAVQNLKGLVNDLVQVSKDRESYWQFQLEREADMRRLWEESMTQIAKDQEVLEERFEESEEKRKRTRKALREVLGTTTDPALDDVDTGEGNSALNEQVKDASNPDEPDHIQKIRRAATQYVDLSDTESAEDEEFFDAIDSGEVEVVNDMHRPRRRTSADKGPRGDKAAAVEQSYKGYEDRVRTHLNLDADNRPKTSLWGILKSMIGKDMTKMTLPVSFNEPTSLLQRIAEDMEYSDLLDIAADRTDSTERLLYVASFAASEYASTIGRVAKPFNPLLGETFEYVRPDKGYRFIIEQVSHHPPIGAVCAESPNWDYFGESAMKSKFYGKSFEFNPLGTWFLRLRPASGGEELYTWKKITTSVVGIITNNPTVDNYGTMEVKNWTTGEVCLLDFKQRGWTSAGAYEVRGKVLDANGKTVWSIGGHWNDKIYARYTPGQEMPVSPPSGASSIRSGGQRSMQAFLVWEAHARPQNVPFNLTPFGITLNAIPDNLRPYLPPTDTRLRPDQRAMENGEYDLAAQEKVRLEEKQRAKRREREAKGEEFVPRWFAKAKCNTTGDDYWLFDGDYWEIRGRVAQGGQWKAIEEIF
ncbi:MAG: hypothetical protein M1816_003963 [Peltula sp. TS41687]|nr:MAG: hypothetical protein M1816_003963 [Peltula sp. TS41687]